MAKERPSIRLSDLPPHDRDRLLYLIAKWRVQEKLSQLHIARKIENWIRRNAPDPSKDVCKVHPTTVGHYFMNAVEQGFVQLGRFSEQYLADSIVEALRLQLENVKIVVAPDRHELLRYVWLDLDKLLTRMVQEADRDKVIVGVSGGHTMLELANVARNMAGLEWHQHVRPAKRKKVTVCSLTSGGIRSDIAALSDTVAASIADHLGANPHGLLGPAWFGSKSALTAFGKDPDVQEHIELVKKADIILTSVGYLRDRNNLMRQLLEGAKEATFVKNHDNLADMLYNCYDGLDGKRIELPDKVASGLFSVMTLEELRRKVKEGTRCVVVAAGEEKGSHALPGVLKNRMASHLYIDRACAEGLLKAAR